jgi:hypothetical protein
MPALIDRVTKKSAPHAAPTPPDAEDQAAIRAHLAEQRLAVARMQGELDQLEAAIAGLKVARSLGEPYDAKELAALLERRDALDAELADALTVTAGLETRVATWDGLARDARYADDLAALDRIEAARPEAERAYLDTAGALVAAAQKLNALRLEHRLHSLQADGYQRARGIQRRLPREPYAPFAVPDSFVRFAEPVVAWEQWSREWVGYRPGFGEPAERSA